MSKYFYYIKPILNAEHMCNDLSQQKMSVKLSSCVISTIVMLIAISNNFWNLEVAKCFLFNF